MPVVVPNSQVAHLWAAQTRPAARSGNGNFHFSGPSLSSYAAHIAEIVTRPGAPADSTLPADRAALVTTRRDSMISNVTTQRHISRARSAASHLLCFAVPVIRPISAADHARNLETLRAAYDATAAARVTARRAADYGGVLPEWTAEGAKRARDAMADYCQFFGLSAEGLPDLDSDLAAARAKWAELAAKYTAAGAPEKRAAEAEKRRAAKARAEAKRAAEIAAQNAEAISEWRAGARHSLPYGAAAPGGFAMLRVRGDKLETSQGASVPLADAVRVFQFVKLVRARGETWQRNGATIRVGGFMVDRIAPDGTMRAGCHLIPWAEIEAAAEAASVATLPASAAVVEESAHG